MRPASAGHADEVRHSRQEIEAVLRQRMLGQVYPPGSRLPSRRALQEELGGSPVTVQAAFDHLAEQGYLISRGSRGTFVADCLPHQSIIALVFCDGFEHGSWNRFWSALHRTASVWSAPNGAPTTFRPYCLVDGVLSGPVYRQLCTDISEGALAGILFASPPPYNPDSPLFIDGLPRVCIDSAPIGSLAFSTSHIHPSDHPVLREVFRHFQSTGRKRCAGLAAGPEIMTPIRELALAEGLDARQEWWHFVPTDSFGALASRRIIHLLGTLSPRERPDCLLIADDNLVPAATNGLLDAAWQAPREVEVAAHANLPLITHAGVPCLRYGLDANDVLRAAADEITALARGGAQRMVEVPFILPEALRHD